MISTPLLITLSFAVTEAFASFCNLSNVTVSTTPTLPPPSNPLQALVVGVGNQLYKCNETTGNFSSAGAEATLYDLSCKPNLTTSSVVEAVQELFTVWNSDPANLTQRAEVDFFKIVGKHYFESSFPIFDFTNVTGNLSAFFAGVKAIDVPSPDGTQNVHWLRLDVSQGSFGKSVDRSLTKGGVPPNNNCTRGDNSTLKVKYAAMYTFSGEIVKTNRT